MKAERKVETPPLLCMYVTPIPSNEHGGTFPFPRVIFQSVENKCTQLEQHSIMLVYISINTVKWIRTTSDDLSLYSYTLCVSFLMIKTGLISLCCIFSGRGMKISALANLFFRSWEIIVDFKRQLAWPCFLIFWWKWFSGGKNIS